MISRLEEITELLESNKIELEDSIQLYEEGIAISTDCITSLKEAELKITELKNKLADISQEESAK
ncbi:MAG TPA: exodeoxyribonuclease VII small subunit [Ignavibacteriaceae bacterium]|nr:exodeoxyribonuclease VII small subunit [Ignavibacteriaceae bacterium]HOJ19384.1 exodeoxyribonuclease VII small subunit [Ignavibacteriaceae bacterium]